MSGPEFLHSGKLARNAGTELDLDAVDGRAGQYLGDRAAGGDARDAAHGQEGLAGGLAAEGRHLHRPDDARGRRHRGAGPAALPQGAAADPAGSARRASGCADAGITIGAVCVYHDMVPAAVDALEGTGIPVAAVSTGFPAGLSPLRLRVRGDRGVGGGGRARDRHRHLPRATCSPATGRRSTTRSGRSAPPAARRT